MAGEARVPSGHRDVCEAYIGENGLTCSLFTLVGECERKGSLVEPVGDRRFSFDLSSFADAGEAISALRTAADAELRGRMAEFREAGIDHVYAYVEENAYEDGKLVDVWVVRGATVDHWPFDEEG